MQNSYTTYQSGLNKMSNSHKNPDNIEKKCLSSELHMNCIVTAMLDCDWPFIPSPLPQKVVKRLRSLQVWNSITWSGYEVIKSTWRILNLETQAFPASFSKHWRASAILCTNFVFSLPTTISNPIQITPWFQISINYVAPMFAITLRGRSP